MELSLRAHHRYDVSAITVYNAFLTIVRVRMIETRCMRNPETEIAQKRQEADNHALKEDTRRAPVVWACSSYPCGGEDQQVEL